MPGPEATYAPEAYGLQDFYPQSDDEMRELLTWCTSSFDAAQAFRQSNEDRWGRYYRLYRSYIRRNAKDWHSKVFYPLVFWVIETVAPRLVSSMPKARVSGIGEEDVESAKVMEHMLGWSMSRAQLYLQFVSSVKSSLIYGTGVMKCYHKQDIRRSRRYGPQLGPSTMATQQVAVEDPDRPGTQLADVDGNPVWENREIEVPGAPVMGWERYSYAAYDGPVAEDIDVFNFFPAAEAENIEDARFVCQRVYREFGDIMRKVQEGSYRLPDNLGPNDIVDVSNEPKLQRLGGIGLGGSMGGDPMRRPVELLEFWTGDGRVITMVNRKAILRAHENPFDHGQKPFVRIIDHMAPHEFWGIGEVEALEGLQDLINALTNQRVDNLRMILNAMFSVNTAWIEDLDDLRPRPGGVVRVREEVPVRDAVERLEMGNVTSTAYAEVQSAVDMVERASAVTSYTAGLDSPSQNDTATGVSLLQEAAATRFTLKTRLMELMGLQPLMEQFGSNMIQFMDQAKVIRIFGPAGEQIRQTVTPESLVGAFDYDIEVGSSAQTESQRRSDAVNLLNAFVPFMGMPDPMTGMPILNPRQPIRQVLDAWDIRDQASWFFIPPMMMGPDGAPMPMTQGLTPNALTQPQEGGGEGSSSGGSAPSGPPQGMGMGALAPTMAP